jgi:hypothetical protein
MRRLINSRAFGLNAVIICLAFFSIAYAAQVDATQPIGTVIKGFSLPQLDANGKPTSFINGDEARVISVNRTEIINMKIELYEGNEIATVITSPKCDLWRALDRLRTRDGVVIKRKDMEFSAQTMDWEYKAQRGILRDNVKVVLSNFSLDQPAIPVSAPKSSALDLAAPVPETSSSLLTPIPTTETPAP